MANTESISVQLKTILEEYDEDLKRLVARTCKTVAEETAEEVKNNAISVVGNGKYARGWKATEKKGGWVVHNERHYQLTHLLENGHAIANQFGKYGGRTRAFRHIAPAERRGIMRFEEEIEKGANNL